MFRWLIAWVWFNPKSQDQIGAVIECAQRIGRKGFTSSEAEAVVQEASLTPKQMKADDLAKWLGVTYVARQLLGLTRIGAKDVGKRARKELRKRNDRLAKERKRRELGALSQSQSLSRTQPWQAEGISRRTWERRRNKSRTAIVATSSTAVFLRVVDTLASAESPQERSRRGRQARRARPPGSASSQACLTTSAPRWEVASRGKNSTTLAVDEPKTEGEKKGASFRVHFGLHERPDAFFCEGSPKDIIRFPGKIPPAPASLQPQPKSRVA